MEKNKVDITIRSQKYSIITGEAPENLIALAQDLDGKLSEILDNSRLSLNQALVLVALDLANESKKNVALAESFKAQIADYLEDAENAKTERDKYKRELDKLKKA